MRSVTSGASLPYSAPIRDKTREAERVGWEDARVIIRDVALI